MLDHEDDSSILHRDFSLALAAVFIVMFIIILPFIQPIGKDDKDEVKSSGNLIFELIWPADNPVDVDLWILSPDREQIGYSNPSGKYLNLLRDDVGSTDDPSGLNYENGFSRGIVPGKYIVNVHIYSYSPPARLPIKVRVILSVKVDDKSKIHQFYAVELTFRKLHEEQTALQFVVGEDQKIDFSKNSIEFFPFVNSLMEDK